MLIRESEWLGQRMLALPPDELFPLLNVGSSTLDFRTRHQPHIERNIFAPLRERGGEVWHLDIKPAPGVDLVGDLADPAFLEKVSHMKVRSVLVSNLFEHVTNRQEIARLIMKVVPEGGYIFVSGPHAYPYHADPIDTRFRPTVGEMADHFPGTRIIDSAIIDGGNWRQWDVSERGGRTLPRTLLRMALPFYKPSSWWALARRAPYIVRHIKAFAVVLRKQEAARP
jgi:hypothetical protein